MRLVVAQRPEVRRLPRARRKSLAGQCVLLLLGLQLMFFSSFVGLTLPTPTGKNLQNFAREQAIAVLDCVPARWRVAAGDYWPNVPYPTKPVRYTTYTPQAPAAILLGYILGWPLATVGAGLFLLIGTAGPFFGINPLAAGGGPDYCLQPTFGYLLGLIAATAVVGMITRERTSIRQILGWLAGVATIHALGLVYLLASSLIFNLFEHAPRWIPWVFEEARNLSWYQIPYDLLFSILLIGVAFPLRQLVALLVAPDIALKSKNDIIVQQRIEELLG
ncbi:MAG TPA: biotin transporter BioY [Chroococcales cyanobacterium]